MNTLSHLKKLRLSQNRTQKEVADMMGVSQPNYQRWESGTAPVPKSKLKKLAQALSVSVDDILGKPKPFDFSNINNNIDDSRTYYGETAIHFKWNGQNLLAPISEAVYSKIFSDIQGNFHFIKFDSLDNRILFVRKEAIADLYFSSDAYDTFGPESYEQDIAIYPDDDFWLVVEHLDMPEYLEDAVPKERVDKILDNVILDDKKLQQYVSDGKVKMENIDTVKKEAAENLEKLQNKANTITWQLSKGEKRTARMLDDEELYNSFHHLDDMFIDGECNEVLYLPVEGYHRSIFINLNAIDYISIPKHKYNIGELESFESEETLHD